MSLLKCAFGDIIGVPARKDGAWGFVLARIILADRVVTWSEVFSEFHTNFSITEDEILAKNLSVEDRLFPPIYTAFDFSRFDGKIKWPILAHDSGLTLERVQFSEIEFETERYKQAGIYIKGRVEFREPPGVRRSLQNRQIYSNTQLIDRINLHFEGYLKQGDVCNSMVEREILAEKGGWQDEKALAWWAERIKSCLPAADMVAQRFVDARKPKRSRAKAKTAPASD